MATKQQLANLAKGRATRAANLKKAGKKPIKKVTSKTKVSRATGKAPTKRLQKRRSKNTVAGYFPNPRPVKKITPQYILKVVSAKGKIGYYTGDDFDTDKELAKQMNKLFAERTARHVFKTYLDNLRSVEVVPVKKPEAGYRKNPVPASKALQVREAADLFEDFTGHKAAHYTQRKITLPTVALHFGDCDGIMYETVRDGVKEHYVHKFKKSARPILAASHDGKSLHLVGGNYRFTNRGIVDN